MVKFEGTFKRTECQMYDEFLSELGLNFFLRKAATISTPVMVIKKVEENGQKWKVVTSTTLKSMEMEFEVK